MCLDSSLVFAIAIIDDGMIDMVFIFQLRMGYVDHVVYNYQL